VATCRLTKFVLDACLEVRGCTGTGGNWAAPNHRAAKRDLLFCTMRCLILGPIGKSGALFPWSSGIASCSDLITVGGLLSNMFSQLIKADFVTILPAINGSTVHV